MGISQGVLAKVSSSSCLFPLFYLLCTLHASTRNWVDLSDKKTKLWKNTKDIESCTRLSFRFFSFLAFTWEFRKELRGSFMCLSHGHGLKIATLFHALSLSLRLLAWKLVRGPYAFFAANLQVYSNTSLWTTISESLRYYPVSAFPTHRN